MTRPENAKYCPRCATMNYADAPACRHCEHRFRTGQDAPASEVALPDVDLNRTQMFTLSPLLQQAMLPTASDSPGARLRAVLRLVAGSPLLLVSAALFLIVVALVICALKLGLIGR